MAAAGGKSSGSSKTRSSNQGGQAKELQTGSGQSLETQRRTPLFHAEHAARYDRQRIIVEYQELTGANLVVMIDQITPTNMTILEDLLFDCDPSKDLHLLLASPGGDGETALRMVRSMQQRCRELTVIIPDLAKSAATILCLGAHCILMGPGGDLGPIDPQMISYTEDGRPRLVASAKEIVEAVDEAEKRVTTNPDSYPLFASLLSDVNMLMVEQARFALGRSAALMEEALKSPGIRDDRTVQALAEALRAPLIEVPTSHSAVVSPDDAISFGLPVLKAETASIEWNLLWSLWTRYFAMGCWPAGLNGIYEGARASHKG